MEVKKKRLTLDLAPGFQHRLKVIAALKGVSMRRYCLTAIGRELSKDEANGQTLTRFSFKQLEAARDAILENRVFPGDSVALIREARASRTR